MFISFRMFLKTLRPFKTPFPLNLEMVLVGSTQKGISCQ